VKGRVVEGAIGDGGGGGVLFQIAFHKHNENAAALFRAAFPPAAPPMTACFCFFPSADATFASSAWDWPPDTAITEQQKTIHGGG